MADQVWKFAFLLFSVCLWVQTCHSSTDKYSMPGHSLKPGDILNQTTQLCSARNISCMSFSMISDDPDFTYLQISTDNIQYIWIGNGDEPVVNNSGVLTLDHSGSLKITSRGKPIKVLYSPIRPINNTLATLFDNGSFVLQELHPNKSTKSVLWQSFDYPTCVLLPGMKLGVNHKTRHNWSLVSWITDNNPASGDFTLEWEPIRHELIIRVRRLVFWKSGSYRSKKPFENIPEEFHSFYYFSVVSNEEEDSITFTNKSNDMISYWFLSPDGSVYDKQSGKYIVRADKCYGFDGDRGCQKLKNMSACWSPVVNFFDPFYAFINFTDNRNSEYVENNTDSRLTRVDCWQICWSNCECVGFYTINDNVTGCTFLRRKALHVITYILHPGDPKESQIIYLLKEPLHREGKKKWIWISVVIATSLLIICLFLLCLACWKRKFILEVRAEWKRKSTKAKMLDLLASNESTSANDLQEEINKGHDLTIFSYESIMEATKDFSLENKLGQGGFGPVYKGILPTGKEVAIKTLSKASGQGVVEFKNELTLICELQHMNLVQLLGYCIHEEEKILVYEYMPNKSLDFFLFDSTRGGLLDWETRFNIIEGVAQGLLYLHKYSRLKVIHRDLKASNILLDEYMNPKISDFGMARMFTQDSEANTDRIVGTYGYMSPEYAMEGIFSTKSDVYSFGVLLLEIVSGRRNNSFYNVDCDGPLNLIAYAWDLWKESATLQLVDLALKGSYNQEEVLRCINIGILCVEENPDDRPTMSNIVSILTNKSVTLSLPKKPAILYVRRSMFEEKTSSKESNIASTCEISISPLDSR